MRPTTRLLVVLGICAFITLGAAGAPVWWAPAWLALALAGLLVALDARRTWAEPPPGIQRRPPERVQIGQPFEVLYTLSNPTLRPIAVQLLDDRGVAFGGDLELGTVRLAAHETTTFARPWTARRRGSHLPGPLHGVYESRLGLLQRRLSLPPPSEPIRVLPNPGAEGAHPVGVDDAAGPRPKRRRGEGMELDALRPYASGDDPRHVDWRATARAARLIVRTFREERNHSLLIAVDTGRMMGSQIGEMHKLDHALNTAVALARSARRQGDRVGFAAFDSAVRSWIPAGDARQRLGALLEATLTLQPREVESSFQALSEQLQRAHRKRSLLIILTDFIEDADALGLQGHLVRLARRHVVLLVALRDPILEDLGRPAPMLDEQQMYRRLVLQDLAAQRDVVLRSLSRMGVYTLDVPPERARGPVLSRYLELRGAL